MRNHRKSRHLSGLVLLSLLGAVGCGPPAKGGGGGRGGTSGAGAGGEGAGGSGAGGVPGSGGRGGSATGGSSGATGTGGTGGTPGTGGNVAGAGGRGGAPGGSGGGAGGVGGGGAGAGGGGAGAGGAPAADGPPGPGGADAPRPSGPVTLPLVVTDHFENQGWFADATITAHFTPGSMVIKQVNGTTGPCAARPAGARGKCLEVVYTPPAGLVPPPTGGWVGVYLLRSLAMLHPEVMPPARPGEPNWGLEPGLEVAPGATKISFYAASAAAGTRVTFRAGIDKDSFVLPEKSEPLTTTWTQYTLPLAGATYGPGLLGAFAWVIKDTARPATFYIDSILWEGGGATEMPPRAPAGMRDGVRQMVFINQCKQTVWVGAYGAPAVPENGGFRLDAGQRRTITVPNNVMWTGRFWGRTGCQFDGAGNGTCATGDCGARERCGGSTGKTPATLAEFTFHPPGPDPDFYDLSLVDGYNLPMAIAPLEGTYTRRPGAAYDCLVPSCISDLNASCPADLRLVGPGGQVVGCLSACEKFKTDQYCCAGAHNTPQTCPPFDHSRTFKAACPTAYSYAYDDATSTFTCKGEDYAIWFCP